mgnify:CR=1 FL=1
MADLWLANNPMAGSPASPAEAELAVGSCYGSAAWAATFAFMLAAAFNKPLASGPDCREPNTGFLQPDNSAVSCAARALRP